MTRCLERLVHQLGITLRPRILSTMSTIRTDFRIHSLNFLSRFAHIFCITTLICYTSDEDSLRRL